MRGSRYLRGQRLNYIKKRVKILKRYGSQEGTMYEAHVEKIKKHPSLFAKHGNLLHYARGRSKGSCKVRDKKYRGKEYWPARDIRKMAEGLDVYLDI